MRRLPTHPQKPPPSVPASACETVHPDQLITRLAAKQHGIVARRQLTAAGLSENQVDRRIRRGMLARVHRGVFRVGPIEARLWREMAAALVCGAEAVVSHLSAAVVWDLWARAGDASVDVITRNGTRPHAGIRLHRARSLLPVECVRRAGIQVTSVARTLLDVAGVASVRNAERVLAEALSRGLVREPALLTMLQQHPGLRGAGVLGALLDAGPTHTRSEAEDRFLALMQEAGLPRPQVNVKVASYEVDFHWPAAALVVEVDGIRFHLSRAAFRKDRRRDAELIRTGLRVLRVTWDQLTDERVALAVLVAQALGPPAR